MSNAVELALPLIKRFEGFRAAPYQDAVGVWTIGYGTTWIDGKPVGPTTGPLDKATLSAMLSADVQHLHLRVRMASGGRNASPSEEAALLSFAYNLGFGALRGSTLFRLHKAGSTDLVALEFPKWRFAGGRVLPGLVLRRAAEQKLYLA